MRILISLIVFLYLYSSPLTATTTPPPMSTKRSHASAAAISPLKTRSGRKRTISSVSGKSPKKGLKKQRRREEEEEEEEEEKAEPTARCVMPRTFSYSFYSNTFCRSEGLAEPRAGTGSKKKQLRCVARSPLPSSHLL
jgi:hypothetical protein